MGMADAGQLPKFLSKRSKYGTPTIAIMMSATGVILTSPLDFTAIVELVNILYIFAELIEFASFIKLRQT
jgi:amino acid transporter